jgi:hypothetical protein
VRFALRAFAFAVPVVACSFYGAADDSAPLKIESNDASSDAPAGDGGAPIVPVEASTDSGPAPCLGNVDCERYVFVTSTKTTGAIGGLEAADTYCQQLADASTRVKGRHFRAWLSDSNNPAKARVPHGTKPYKRTDGVVIANNFASILDTETILDTINVDENGGVVPTTDVWTATSASGIETGGTCGDWTIGTNADSGRSGSAADTDFHWSDGGFNDNCDTPERLYCFEN